MKSTSPHAEAPPDIVARVFSENRSVLTDHAVALLLKTDVARHGAQAKAMADDILQNAQEAALSNTHHFTEVTERHERLSKAKTFVFNAVRDERDHVFKRRRAGQRVSDDWREPTNNLAHDAVLDLMVGPVDTLPKEITDARCELIANLPREIDRLTITLSDEGYEGQGLADAISERLGHPYSYAAATARLSRVRAWLVSELQDLFRT